MSSCENWEQGWDWFHTPIGHETFGEEPWLYPGQTYDQNCITQGWIAVGAWPPHEPVRGITWLFDSVMAEGVRVEGGVTRSFGPYINAVVRAEVDGEWVVLKDCQCCWFTPGQLWTFDKGILTKFEIFIRHTCGAAITMFIFEVAAGLRQVTCRGPLRDICVFLYQVGTFFIDLSLDIAELCLVGGFLSAPFEFLGELFYIGAEVCCSASSTLQTVVNIVEQGVTAAELWILFQTNFPTLYVLITDPAGWFLVQLTLAFNLEPWHTQSLEFLAKWVLEEYFPTLYQIWLNPEDWFTILLQDRFPILYYLVVDPIGEILYLIGQAFDLTPWEAQSAEFIVKALFERYFRTLYELWLAPEAWLVEHVDPRILGLPTTVAAFFDDPWGWLFDRLEDQLETYAERIGEMTLEIVARLLGV